LRSNAETWTAQDNYENYRYHDTYVANGQVNILVETYKSNMKEKTVGTERNNIEK